MTGVLALAGAAVLAAVALGGCGVDAQSAPVPITARVRATPIVTPTTLPASPTTTRPAPPT